MSGLPPPIEKTPEPIPSQLPPQEGPVGESLETKTQKAAGSVIRGTEKSTWKKAVPHHQASSRTATTKGLEPEGIVAKVKAEHLPPQAKVTMGNHRIKEIRISKMWEKETGKMNWKKVNQYLKEFAPSAPEFQQSDIEGDAEGFFEKLRKIPSKNETFSWEDISYEATTPSTTFHKKERALAARMLLTKRSTSDPLTNQFLGFLTDPNSSSQTKKIWFVSVRLHAEADRRRGAIKSTWEEREIASEVKEDAPFHIFLSIYTFGVYTILFLGPLLASVGISYGIKTLIEKARQGKIVDLGRGLKRELQESRGLEKLKGFPKTPEENMLRSVQSGLRKIKDLEELGQ